MSSVTLKVSEGKKKTKTPAVTKQRKIRKVDEDIMNVIGIVILSLVMFICIVPFWTIIVSSFRSESSLLTKGYSILIKDFSLEAYKMVFRDPSKILGAYRNTIMITCIGTFCAVFMATMTGYVLQRQDFPWRNKISFFFFFTTLFSGGLVPTYLLNTKVFGFKNSYLGMIVPLMFSVWNMIISKTFMRSISFSLTESAKLDGANDIYIYFKIMFPLSKPLIATLCLFSALAYWNDWYFCMLYESKEHMFNLQYFLNEIINSIQALKVIASKGGDVSMTGITLPQETMKMAMTVIATGPIVLLYPFVQKYFVKGLTIGSVKG